MNLSNYIPPRFRGRALRLAKLKFIREQAQRQREKALHRMEVQDLKQRLATAQFAISQLQRDKIGLALEYKEIAKRHARIEITKDPNRQEFRVLATVEADTWTRCDNALRGEILRQLVERFSQPIAVEYTGPR